jgi:hypothetical protein
MVNVGVEFGVTTADVGEMLPPVTAVAVIVRRSDATQLDVLPVKVKLLRVPFSALCVSTREVTAVLLLPATPWLNG